MKIIAVTSRVEYVEKYGERRDCLDQQWSKFLHYLDAVVLPIPNHVQTCLQLLDKCPISGILLTGGNDLYAYGGNALERDETESALIEYAINTNTPLLGVCRGMQMLCVYWEGKLKKISGHIGQRHLICGEHENRQVNSYHSYAIDILPDCFNVRAISEDGVIEQIEHKQYPIYGIMHHPERDTPFSLNDYELFNKYLLSPAVKCQ